MSYRKQSNLSSRSKRRRVEDELRNINIPFNISEDVMVVNYDIPSLIATNKSRSQSKSIVEIDLPTNPNENNTFINLNQNRIQNTTELTEDPIYDSADDEIKYLSSETNEDDDIHLLKNDNDISSIISLITQWAITYNIPQNALSKLLLIFRQHSCFETIPKDARTIMLSNNAKPNLRVVEPGKYHHFGIANGIKKNVRMII